MQNETRERVNRRRLRLADSRRILIYISGICGKRKASANGGNQRHISGERWSN